MALGADSELRDLLKRELNTSKLNVLGGGGEGYISETTTCDTDAGKVFIKINNKDGARTMFEGEVASLQAMADTGTVRVPQPVKVISIPSGGAAIVMENLDIVGRLRSKAALLGEQMARLHLHNAELIRRAEATTQSVHKKQTATQPVKMFGFHVTTCCGYIPQNNEWTPSWEELFARKLDGQMGLIQKDYGDREASQEWSSLQRRLPQFFKGITVTPALVHGDLWGGNVAELDTTPVVYDPASFYGHSEFELSIAIMFGGFPRSFFDSYFKLIPKADGYSTRLQLYQLFHYLNHWNHLGTDYRSESLSIFRSLNKLSK